MQFPNILYVATLQTYFRLDNETLRVEVERETRGPVSLHQFSAVARSCDAYPVLFDDHNLFVGQTVQPAAGVTLTRRG